jgi:hypothetical protein
MTDQVPSNRACNLTGLGDTFLHAILAQVANTRIYRLLYCSWVECLGDSDEGDLFGASIGALGGSRNLFKYSRQPLSYLFGHRE